MTADFQLGFRSLTAETTLDDLPIEGRLPEWLAGTLYRNGPALFELGDERYRHWFDGLAMLHRFTIAGGRLSYANRFLRSPAYLEGTRRGRIARSEFATDPAPTPLERLGLRFGAASSDNANVNIIPHGDGFLALTETPAPVAFDGVTLATLGPRPYDDAVTGQMTTAHPHHDAVRRASFNLVTTFGGRSSYQIVRIADGTHARTVVATIAVDRPAYMHAFSTTADHVVLVEYPLTVHPLDLLFRRRPFIEAYRWRPERAARFHVVHKDSGALAGSYEAAAFFAFHHVNAFEEGDAIVVDISAYDDPAVIESFRLAHFRGEIAGPWPRADLRRFRLTPGRSTAELERLTTVSTELPSVARAKAGRTYRYAYGIDAGASDIADRLVKVDVRTAEAAVWHEAAMFPGEPIFVPRPGADDEDDGALLSVALDVRSGTSCLLVLDAQTLAESARAHVPHHIPFGFHGIFESDDARRRSAG